MVTHLLLYYHVPTTLRTIRLGAFANTMIETMSLYCCNYIYLTMNEIEHLFNTLGHYLPHI